jgi:hypothetical protein
MKSSLVNKGLHIIGVPHREAGPIVVVGVARGGTSMIAGALSKLGVYMGDQAEAPVFEDVLLANAMDFGDFDLARKIANGYERNHEHWGWKRPSSIEYLKDLDEVLMPCAYVFIFKDIFSIAQRNAISMLEDILISMDSANKNYGKCIDFIKNKNPYGLLVSYEKIVANPEALVNYLINLKQLNPTHIEFNSAIEFIQINPENYLDSTRIIKAEGCLDEISVESISGWARYVHSKNPAEVEIFLNDISIGSILANEYRDDLNCIYESPCAFSFKWPQNISFCMGGIIRLRVVNDIQDLCNSPMLINFNKF